MQVCRNHTNLEDVCAFLTSDASQKSTQEGRETGIDLRCALTSGPNEMVVEPMPHSEQRRGESILVRNCFDARDVF